jgi:hypothetical protein
MTLSGREGHKQARLISKCESKLEKP